MSCCNHFADNPMKLIYPDTQCLACCEKHFAQAWDWAREAGYVAVNRQRIIGALASAQAHCWQSHPEIAMELRELRHHIQQRQRGQTGIWENIALKLDALLEFHNP